MKRNVFGYKKKLGAYGEKIAEDFLRETAGYQIVAKNYSCPLGELDLVAFDNNIIVFVEVRSVRAPFAGLAEESIGFRKQKKLRQLASFFLKDKGLEGRLTRFDAIIILFHREKLFAKEIKHIKDAF